MKANQFNKMPNGIFLTHIAYFYRPFIDFKLENKTCYKILNTDRSILLTN